MQRKPISNGEEVEVLKFIITNKIVRIYIVALAKMDFQHLSGARSVTIDFKYDVASCACVVCAYLSL